MKIGIIGSGKVASQLSKGLYKAGHKISFIISRNSETAHKISRNTASRVVSQYNEIDKTVDIILIAVNDDNIATVVENIPTSFKGIVCHTSGAVTSEVITKHGFCSGIFYPLYSFSSTTEIDFSKVPFLLTFDTEKTHIKLVKLAKSLGSKVYDVTNEERKHIHLAAVFANNFGNHMMTKCFDILESHNIDKELILPIINQSGQKWGLGNAKSIQTGPAVRNDKNTLDKHREIIDDEITLKVYNLITKSIKEYYS